MATKSWGEFSSYWFGYCKDTLKQLIISDQNARFSEGLLHTLCYETDVGCIPRGIKLDTTKTQPKYFHSENWNKQPNSCYWCRDDSTSYNGICSSKECFFYLHDWCVERVVYYTGRRFCRLPGCVNITYNNQLYCNTTDKAKFDSLFPKGSDHEYIVNTVIREGPSWYSSKENHSQNKLDNKKVSYLSPFKSDFPTELQELISQQTDIGIIPRGTFSSFNLQPKFSHYPNWSTTIRGCYSCGRTDIRDSTNKYFCQVRCYLIFYEWCRIKVESVTKIRFCQYAGCLKRASEGYLCCNSEHSNGIKKLYEDNSINEIKRSSALTPKWYIKAKSPNELVTPHLSSLTNSQTPSEYQQPYQQPNCGTSTQVTPIMDFPTELHSAMIFKTDIGIIPRSPPREHHLTSPYSSSPNWLRDIRGCYWCGNKSNVVYANFCGYRCYLIFYEWCIRKVHTFTGVKICRDTGCDKTAADGFDCCNREHGKAIEGKYIGVKKVDLDKLCFNAVGPNFYKHCDAPNITLNVETKESLTHSQECVSTLTPQKTSTSLQSSTQPVSPKPLSVVLQESVSSIDSDTILLEPEKGVIHSLSHSYFNPFLNNILLESEKGVIPSISPSYYNPFLDNIPTQQEITSSHPTKSHTDIDTAATQTNLPELHPFTLSRKLTDLLAQHTDVGIIPRSKYQSAVPSPQYSNNINRSADITSCYWCELSNTSFHQLACGRRCWLLFHEWCVRKVESGCGFRLCVLPGCENSRATGCSCCSIEHIKRISELRGSLSPSTEEEVELTLGPKWYTDISPVYFSRTGAFYEFSNYFPSLLLLDGCVWPTVYHYLCAQKLIGTPYSNQICGMECISELERWMKRRTLGKWVRPDWSRVCEGVTHKSVFTKFEQNKVLKGMLLRTGRRPLVCRDGSLGDMLVSLREWFRTYRCYPNQQTTKIHLTPNADISEIVSKTSPPPGYRYEISLRRQSCTNM